MQSNQLLWCFLEECKIIRTGLLYYAQDAEITKGSQINEIRVKCIWWLEAAIITLHDIKAAHVHFINIIMLQLESFACMLK